MEKWTRFMDMHSGGDCKLPPYNLIYINSDIETAKKLFETKFNRDPENITCECCGEDYSIDEYNSLEEATAYERNCRYKENKYIEEGANYIPLNKYLTHKNILVISENKE